MRAFFRFGPRRKKSPGWAKNAFFRNPKKGVPRAKKAPKKKGVFGGSRGISPPCQKNVIFHFLPSEHFEKKVVEKSDIFVHTGLGCLMKSEDWKSIKFMKTVCGPSLSHFSQKSIFFLVKFKKPEIQVSKISSFLAPPEIGPFGAPKSGKNLEVTFLKTTFLRPFFDVFRHRR